MKRGINGKTDEDEESFCLNALLCMFFPNIILSFLCRVRVSWGRLENFKCVDYFRIEYYEQNDKAGTLKQSERIDRHRRSHDIDIKPCKDYVFKVSNMHESAVTGLDTPFHAFIGYCIRRLERNKSGL